jgi:hypothetical protein
MIFVAQHRKSAREDMASHGSGFELAVRYLAAALDLKHHDARQRRRTVLPKRDRQNSGDPPYRPEDRGGERAPVAQRFSLIVAGACDCFDLFRPSDCYEPNDLFAFNAGLGFCVAADDVHATEAGEAQQQGRKR